jgi:hypothetical protein
MIDMFDYQLFTIKKTHNRYLVFGIVRPEKMKIQKAKQAMPTPPRVLNSWRGFDGL